MMAFVITIHVIICLLLIIIILIQAGRGGGLIENFSGMESMFGTKTNSVLTRLTTILSILFFITCVSLAFLSAQRSKSLLRNLKSGTGANEPASETTKTDTAAQPTVAPVETKPQANTQGAEPQNPAKQ